QVTRYTSKNHHFGSPCYRASRSWLVKLSKAQTFARQAQIMLLLPTYSADPCDEDRLDPFKRPGLEGRAFRTSQGSACALLGLLAANSRFRTGEHQMVVLIL